MVNKNSSSTRSSTNEDVQNKHNITSNGKAKALRVTNGSQRAKLKIARPLMFGLHARSNPNHTARHSPLHGIGSYCTAYHTFNASVKLSPPGVLMLTRRFVFPPLSIPFLRAGRGVSTYHKYLLAISHLGDHDPCSYHMLMGPATYKGPLTRSGFFTSFPASFTLFTSITLYA